MREPIECSGKSLPSELKTVCRANKKIQKSHDFKVNEPILSGEGIKYLILIRHPIAAIISRWRLIGHSEGLDKKQDLENFFKSQIAYYFYFAKKYIPKAEHLTPDLKHSMAFSTYEEITTNIDDLLLAMKYISPSPFHIYLEKKKDEIQSFINVRSKGYDSFPLFDENFVFDAMKQFDFSFIRKRDGTPLINQ